MPEKSAHIYRNSNGLLGGVCCGIAERFDFDVALVRLSVIILTVLSSGAFALVYVAAWLILPAKPQLSNTVDVDPAAFQSEVYEQVVSGPASQVGNFNTSIPPTPPAAAASYYQAPRVSYATMPAPDAAQVSQSLPTSRSLKVGVGLGMLLIALGALFMLSNYYVIDMNAWVTHAGPILLISVGLFIMGRAGKSDILILCAALALAAFIAVGAYSSIQEGPTEWDAALPFSPEAILEDERA